SARCGLVRGRRGGGARVGSWRWARCCRSSSATSAADWKRSAGSRACRASTISASHAGTSGHTWRTGRGARAQARGGAVRAGAPAKGGLAGAQGVQDATEAEQVGAVVDALAARLLRRHVGGGARDDARLRQAGVVAGAGQAEVGQLDALDAVLQEDVGRL